MGLSIGRGVFVAACLVWLAGCTSTPLIPEDTSGKLNQADTPPDGVALSAGETTVSTTAPPTPFDSPPATPSLLGKDPNDDLSIGKKYFRQGSYGLAERHFRKAV